MIDHLGFAVADIEKAKAFYVRALEPLGIGVIIEVTPLRARPAATPMSASDQAGKPYFWIGGGKPIEGPVHIAFTAPSRAAVDAFYHAGAGRRRARQRRAGHPRPLPSELLRRLRV